jgi:hypothetical protein
VIEQVDQVVIAVSDDGDSEEFDRLRRILKRMMRMMRMIEMIGMMLRTGRLMRISSSIYTGLYFVCYYKNIGSPSDENPSEDRYILCSE